MIGKQLFVCSVLLLAVQHVLAFPNGAPSSPNICESMTPKHGDVTAAAGTGSYSVKAAKSSSIIEGEIRGASFKGFMLQARSGGKPIGTFAPVTGSKTLDCSGGSQSSVTHTDNKERTSQSFKWTPPKDFTGSVNFVATVVKELTTFHTNIQTTVTV